MKILFISLFAWFIAQFTKIIYFYYLNKKFNLKLLFSSGGMPSAHSAFISAVAIQIGLQEGFESSMFALAVSIAFIVIYDAFNVRRAVGLQGITINLMLDYYKDNDKKEDIRKLKEVMGHTPLQVIIGSILGVATGFLGYIVS